MMRVFRFLMMAATLVFAGCSQSPSPADPAFPLSAEAPSMLRADGLHIVDADGRIVQLRGVNSGSWLLIEPWMLSIDEDGVGSEKELWDVIGQRFGEDAKQEIIRLHRDTFFTEDDVRRIADAGLNSLRIPIWWRAVSDPAYGGDIDYLDRCLEWCERYGLYAVIDLHGTPGGQSDEDKIVGEPSDAALWTDEAFRDQTVAWWEMIATRYRDNPTVAGYDLINEAFSASVEDLVALYDRIYKAIRAIGDEHLIFIEDGLLGFHRLPRPVDMGWSNVCYSFHYYPQDPAEAMEAPRTILPRFQRMALYYDVPILVGEFNTMMLERGGADLLRRYCEVFDYYGWSWTLWNYKVVDKSYNYNWGFYGYGAEPSRARINDAPLEQLRERFASFATDQLKPHPLLSRALAPTRFMGGPEQTDSRIGFEKAVLLPGAEDQLRLEWSWDQPNAGFWQRTDRVAFACNVNEPGVYRLSVQVAGPLSGRRMALYVDGVHITDAALSATGGWGQYAEIHLANRELTAGRHVVELAQADGQDGFVNLRGLHILPTGERAFTAHASEIRCTPLTMKSLRTGSPIRIEWFNDPPNFGYWLSGEEVHWSVDIETTTAYRVEASYSTPNAGTRLEVQIDGETAGSRVLDATDDWQTYQSVTHGTVSLPAGTHVITAAWHTDNPEGAGNLRSIRLVK